MPGDAYHIAQDQDLTGLVDWTQSYGLGTFHGHHILIGSLW